MSFRLPTLNHPAREAVGDIAALAVTLDPANAGRLPTLQQARRNALALLAATPAASRVNSVVLRLENDERHLISFGPKGGWRKVWNFGTGRA